MTHRRNPAAHSPYSRSLPAFPGLLGSRSQRFTAARLTKIGLAALLALGSAAWLAGQPAQAADNMAKTGTKFDADKDMQRVLDTLGTLGGKPIESLSVEQARTQPTPTDAVMTVLKKDGKKTEPSAMVPGVTSADTMIPGPAGQLPVRIYTPSGTGPFPVIVYYHGGGWVIADKEVYDGGARGLAKEAKAVVVSVDYRRAPEAKFPAAWDDALATYKWAQTNAASIKGDPKRMALAGESAGGNLAVSTAVAVRDAGLPMPKHVLAVYPVAQTGNLETESYKDSATAKPLNKAMIGWFVDKVFAKPEQKSDPRVDIVNAKLQGLPPVTIVNAEIDPLRSDGKMLEDALEKAGVKVDRKVYEGTAHEFFGAAAVVDDAQDAQQWAGKQLRASFGD